MNVVGRVMYTTSSNNEVFGLADIFYRSATTPSTAKYTYEDGTLAPGQNRSIGNPVYHLKNDVRKNSKDNLSLSIAADWEILPGFSFTPQLSLYKYTYDGYSFIPAYWNGSMTYNDSREATGSYNKTMQGQMDLVLGYQKLFAESHNLDVKAGFSYFGIGILFDYYRRVTDNLITSLSLPPSTGFASIYTNLGRLENKGIELEVNAAVLPAWSGLQWNVAMTATHTKHKILRLPENGAENNRIGGEYVWVPSKKDYAWMGGLQEGGRVGDIYGHVLEGVYATDEEAQNDPVVNTLIPGNDKTKYGGYAKFRDVDGNGQIDSKDKVYLGNFYPTWNGGFTNSFSFRGLTFSVRFDYTLGHKIYNYATRFMDNNSQGDGNLTKNMAKNSWKQQGDQASMPCYIWNQSYNLPVNCNIYVEKGDFLCLREMTLAYELPKRLLRKIGLAGVRVHVTGNNLHYFTDFKGLNPEEGGQDNGRYPIPRNIITGISITL